VNDKIFLDIFSGCLSLAELGRRGLLLPQRLPDGKSYRITRID